MARKTVNGAAVRAWAQTDEGAAALAEAGLTVGSRGRFSQAVQDLFRKSTGSAYEVGKVTTVKVSGIRVSESGRKVPVQVNATLSELRAFGRENGFEVGSRGRVSAELKAAFAAAPRS
jgi:hypothetical protein